MALGDIIGDTADELRGYLSDIYSGLRRVAIRNMIIMIKTMIIVKTSGLKKAPRVVVPMNFCGLSLSPGGA